MRRSGYSVILVDDERCRVLAVRDADRVELIAETGSSPLSPEQATEIAAALDRERCHRATVLALPSEWCLCSTVSADGLPRQQRRQAMLYRLEEKLPLAAEEIVADFITFRDKGLGVCTEIARLSVLVDVLETAGIVIHSICPATFLAVEGYPSEPNDVVVWPRNEVTVELVALQDRKPSAWFTLPANAHDLELHMNSLKQTAPGRVVAMLSDSQAQVWFDELAERCSVSRTDAPSYDHAVARGGALIAQGSTTPYVDLRRDALAARAPYRHLRRPLVAATTASLVFLLTFAAILHWRAHLYDGQAARLKDQQTVIFRKVFPGVAPPLGMHSRLISEERRLRGISGASHELPQQSTAAELLHELLRRLPLNLRYRVLDLNLEPQKILLQGQARSHGDVDTIATALRASNRWQIHPPRTEQLPDKGVSFTIDGVGVSQVSTRGEAK